LDILHWPKATKGQRTSHIQIALVACFFAIPCLTAEDTEVTISVTSIGFLTPVVSRLATGTLCIVIFLAMVWHLSAPPLRNMDFVKWAAIPVVFGIAAAALFNTVFVLEFWVLFALIYLIEYMSSGFINGMLSADWKCLTYGIISLPVFFIVFLAQFFGVNDAIYESVGYSETDNNEETDENEEEETDEDETDENETDESETDDSTDPDDEDTSKGQDDSDAKDGDDEDENENEADDDENEEEEENDDEDDENEVTKDEDVSEDGDDDETEPSSSTTTELTISDGASGTEASVSIKSDVSALPSKNTTSSDSAASTPTVGICSAVAAVVVSIIAFFF